MSTTADVRAANRRAIVGRIRRHGPCTRRDLAAALGLSFATVNTLANDMVRSGILVSRSSKRSDGGRIPHVVALSGRGPCALAVDLVATGRVGMALRGLDGGLRAQAGCAVESPGPESVARACRELFDRMLTEAAIPRRKVIAAGVAVPGIFVQQTGTLINSTVPALDGMRVRELLEDALRVPVYAENDTNLMALACACNGVGDELRDVIYVYAGEGLGLGVVCNGRLVRGSHGLGAEISHIPLGRVGYACSCGARGCIETELSAGGFLRKYTGSAPQPGTQDYRRQWERFAADVAAGKPEAAAVVAENGALLGELVGLLVNVFDPGAVYVGGMVSDIFELLAPYVERRARERQVGRALAPLSICKSEDSTELLYRGCTELVCEHWQP